MLSLIGRFFGVLLLILATLKVFGLAYVLWQGSPDRTTWWMIKQLVYMVAFASIGFRLLSSQDSATNDRS